MNRISSLFNFIANKLGNVSMGTTAQTITGAIAELKSSVTTLQTKPALTTLQTKPALKYYFFSTGSRSWPAGASSFTVQIPATPSGYYLWAMHPRSTNRNITFVLAFSSGQITINAYNASSAAVTGTDMRFTLTQTIFSRFKEIPNEQHYHSYIC